MTNRVVPCLVALLSCSCYYYVEQSDYFTRPGFDPTKVKRVAVLDIGSATRLALLEPGDAFQSARGAAPSAGAGGAGLMWEALNYSFMKRGIYCVERKKIYALVREQQMIDQSFADLGDIEKARRLGKLLNVDLILYGDNLMREHRFIYDGTPMYAVCAVMPPFMAVYAALISDEPGLPSIMFYAALAGSGITLAIEMPRLKKRQRTADQTGTLPGLTREFPVWSRSGTCATLRAIDVATGEIVWVGYKFIVAKREVTFVNQGSLGKFGVLVETADHMVDELLKTSGRASGGGL